MDNINEYIHVIGLIFLGLLLIIVVIYFYNNVINKHTNIVEKYAISSSAKASIDEISDYGLNAEDGTFNTHTNSELKTYEIDEHNKIYLRQCAVYFTGEQDEIAYGRYWLLIDENIIDNAKVKGYGNFAKLDETKFSLLYNLIYGYFSNQDENNHITDPSIPNNSDSRKVYHDKVNKVIIAKESLQEYRKRMRDGNKTFKYILAFDNYLDYSFKNSEINNLFSSNVITMYNYLEIDFKGKKYYFLPAETKNEIIVKKCNENLEYDDQHTCGYKFKDDWLEIDHTTSKDKNGNIIKTEYPYKIYNQGYTNYDKENSQNMMKTCFKSTENGRAIKFKYDNNGLLKYDYSGVDDDNKIGMRTNIDKDVSSGSYINLKFDNSETVQDNYSRILSTICSLKYNKINDDNLAENTKYIKFILDAYNNVKDVQYVAMNSSQTGFNIRHDKPKLIQDAAFGVMIESYSNDIFSGRSSLKLKIFKSIYVPTIHNVEIFVFGYNYLCDNGNIRKFHKKNAHMHLGNMIIPPDPNVQYSKYSLLYNFNDLQIDADIWNDFIIQANQNANKPVDQKIAIIRMLNDQRKNKIEAIKKRYRETKGIITNKLQEAGITDIAPYSDDEEDIGVLESFTNYKEQFEIRDLGQYHSSTEQKNLGLKDVRRIDAAWKDLEISQRAKQAEELSGKLETIFDIERSPITNPYGHPELTDGHKPFDFIKGFYATVNLSDRESVYSAKNKYSSIEALNNNTPITIVTDVYLSLTKPGIKVWQMPAWHQMYSDDNVVMQAAAGGRGLHPRHQRSWDEGGYWTGAYRADNPKYYRQGTPHHPVRVHKIRNRVLRYGLQSQWHKYKRWYWATIEGEIPHGAVNSWAIMKNKMKNNQPTYTVTNNTSRLNGGGSDLYTQMHHTYFLAPHTGNYLWKVMSDDAAMLYAQQVYPYDSNATMKLVVDNAGLHPPTWREGRINMVKGRVYELHATFTERQGQDIFSMCFEVDGYNNNNENYDIMSKNKGPDGSIQAHYYQYMASRTEEEKRLENIKWHFNQDGTFGASIESLKDKPFNLDKVAFMNTPIGSHINPNFYKDIPISDGELRKYYKIEAKGDTKKLYFKASFTELGLVAKYNRVATGASYRDDMTKLSTDYSSHIDVLDDPKYFNIKEDDIMSSISEKKLVIDPWSFVRFAVCGYIYLDAGKYRFYVNNNIPSSNIYKDNKFILQGRNSSILERITENDKDIIVKVSGFYKYSHNCYVLNEAIDPFDYEKSLTNFKYDIESIRNAGHSKEIVIEKLNKMFNYTSKKELGYEDNRLDFVSTIIEFDINTSSVYSDTTTEADLDRIWKKKWENSTAADIINFALKYIDYLLVNQNMNIGKELYPKFSLKCDYESLDGNKKCNKRDLSDALYTGERMYKYYSESNNDNLWENVNLFDDCNSDQSNQLDQFTNYTEHFKDNLAPYLDEQEGKGKDLYGLTGIATVRKQLRELIQQKRRDRWREIKKVHSDFDELIKKLNEKINYEQYFDKYIVEYRKNVNIASIINNSDTDGADVSMLSETEKRYIYDHITYEKIPNKLDRTAEKLNDVNFDYRSKAPRSFYVLESSVTGEQN